MYRSLAKEHPLTKERPLTKEHPSPTFGACSGNEATGAESQLSCMDCGAGRGSLLQ